MLTVHDILTELDQSILRSRATFFPVMQDPERPLILAYLHLWSDGHRWAIQVERLGFEPRMHRFQGQLSHFGNCLQDLYWHDGQPSNSSFYFPLADEEFRRLDRHGYLDPQARQLRLRGQALPIPRDLTAYQEAGILPLAASVDQVSWVALARLLVQQGWAPQWAAQPDELRQHLPADLPYLSRLDRFYLPEYRRRDRRTLTEADMDATWANFLAKYGEGDAPASEPPATGYHGTPPAESELWPQVAQVLVQRQLQRYQPTLPPNNCWRS
jgi:hypothetical protein